MSFQSQEECYNNGINNHYLELEKRDEQRKRQHENDMKLLREQSEDRQSKLIKVLMLLVSKLDPKHKANDGRRKCDDDDS